MSGLDFACEIDLQDICNALGWQGNDPRQAIKQIRAVREHMVNALEVVDLFLNLDDWRNEDIAPGWLIQRAKALRAGVPPPGPMPSRRLPQIASALPKLSALLLESLHVTHADCLRFLSIDHAMQGDMEVDSGHFVHLPTGRHYLVSVVPIPPPESACES